MKTIGKIKCFNSGEIQDSRVSIGFECLDRELFKPEPCYDPLYETGAKYARCQTGWARCEKERGVYDFSWLDEVVDSLLKRHIEVWFNVGYGNPLYMKDIPNKTGVGCVPLYFGEECLAAWLRFVRALAAHFAGRVRLFEIWNEPEADHFWYPKAPDPAEYARLYAITSAEILSQIPEAKFAATVASGFDFDFIRGMLSALRGCRVDYFAYHAHSRLPEVSFGNGQPYLENAATLRRLLDEAGFEKTALIQGEAGQPSWAPIGHWLYKNGFDDPRAQAIWLLRRFALDHYAGVALASFFMIADIWEKPYETATQTLPRAQANGILNGLVYTKKPSYEAFRHICAVLHGDIQRAEAEASVTLSREAEGEEKALCLSFTRNGKPLCLYYIPSAPTERCRHEGAATVRLPQPLCEPILADLLTGEVYDLPPCKADGTAAIYAELPVTNYPLLLTERTAIAIDGE